MSLRDLLGDGTRAVELRGACRTACQHPGVDREGDMRSFAADHRPVRAVEPLPTDLAQRVGPPLRGRALVIVAVRPRLGDEGRAQGGEERFAGFGVALGFGVSDGVGEATARISSRAFFFFSSAVSARTKTPRSAANPKIVPRKTRSRITGRDRNRGECAINPEGFRG